ncbi:mRNA-capping enzyme subunit beta [Golovinomyces cichoracearum]|uniref:mRNA-capping enzyme subunit beta n=1 Tax=Golovinomyces cichoracearum TaxID=62708 RepID=A0A420J539_9PEZI|nr:mRNA-capping enzyme subunit beta [Golovinomyces cichoracearum]
MDLRSIINTDAGDSPIDRKSTPITPVKTKHIREFETHKIPLHISPGGQVQQEYWVQRAGTSNTSSTYRQNYQNRRPPPLPIQAPPPNNLISPSQSISEQSPYKKITPSSSSSSSSTNQFLFPPSQQTPQSPAQPFYDTHTTQRVDNLQILNLPQNINYLETYNQSPSKPQSPTISSAHSAPDSIPALPKTSADKDYHPGLFGEQNSRSRTEIRDRSPSFSPKTRQSSLQKTELSSDLDSEKVNKSKIKMNDEWGDSIQAPGSVQTTNKTLPSSTSSCTHTDIRLSMTSTQKPSRKRVRYTEPPIWARSIRTHGFEIVSKHSLAQAKEKQLSDEAIPFQTSQRIKSNGNGADLMHIRTPAIDSHPCAILGNWEESITGKKPIEHMTKVLADFLYLHVVSRSDLGELFTKGVQIEIEAKLGEIIDRDTNQRYFLPVRSECILAEDLRTGFKSSMTEQQHKKLNEFLNEMVTKTHLRNSSATPRVKIDYLHRREVDKFYELPKTMQAALPAAIRDQIPPYHTAKIRVTHDQKSGNVLAKIIKVRTVNLDIYSGLAGTLDCRVSINLEMPYNEDLDELIKFGKVSNQSPDRSKDRLSYKQSYYQIDLTQVTQNIVNNNLKRTEKEHELEIELSTEAIMDQGRKAASGQANEFLPLIEGFLNNVRVISRFIAEVR